MLEMIETREQIQTYILQSLEKLAQDCDYSGTLGPDTLLMTQLNFESLDLVVLGVSIQEHYGVQLPFAEFLAMIGQREQQDISVTDLVDFLHAQLSAGALPALQKQ
jgi:acyl carrier protein